MPLYHYDSFSRRGERIKGTIDAASIQMAKQILQGQGLMPTNIVEMGTGNLGFSFKNLFEKKIDAKTIIIFTKQLSVLLRAGVQLLQAMELLIEQFEGKFKRVLISIKDGLKSGQPFASELAKYPKIFPNVYIQLIKAGEATGKLYLILDRLVEYLAKEIETKKRIKKAMAYPIFMISFSVLIVVAMVVGLVPKMIEMFKDFGIKEEKLAGPTLFLKNSADFIMNNYLILIVAGIFLFLGFYYWRSTKTGKYKIDNFFLKLPLTAYFSRTKAVVQFSKTLGMLLESGVNLSESLDIVCNIVDNTILVDKLQAARDKIIKEGKISKYLKETGIFPNMAIYMINTGEQSGKLAAMLLSVGNDYDTELTELTDSLIGKIGPVMTMITGAIIIFIILAVFLPMLDIMNEFKF